MKFLVLLCLVAGALAAQDCPANQHYDSCGSACPVTCDNHKNPPKFCVLMCVAGCHCDAGYVKNEQGECVKPDQCHGISHDTCGENETFKECGTACPLTCENYDNPPRICPAMCKIGCECNEGFVRAANGRCVRPENCHSGNRGCQANQHYESCGTACPLTCDNYRDPPQACIKMCNPGCHCDEGYVEDGQGGCVKPEQCHGNAFLGRLDRPDCDKKGETGMCRAYVKRFYYDQEQGMCLPFTYGGCGGNRNNFASEFECYNKCGALASPSACLQEKVVGPCRAAFPRYFFNPQTGKCEYFIYGGCGGNDNNFYTTEECENVCAH